VPQHAVCLAISEKKAWKHNMTKTNYDNKFMKTFISSIPVILEQKDLLKCLFIYVLKSWTSNILICSLTFIQVIDFP